MSLEWIVHLIGGSAPVREELTWQEEVLRSIQSEARIRVTNQIAVDSHCAQISDAVLFPL